MNYNQNSGYGQGLLNRLNAVAANTCPTFGRILVVMNSSDPNYDVVADIVKSDPDGDVRLFSTVTAAYGAAETNRNDVILLGAYSSWEFGEAAMITWAKNRIHVVGMGHKGIASPQPVIYLSDVTVDAAATIKVTGVGNTFTNITIMNAGTHSNSVTALWDAGEMTTYENCDFYKQSDLNVAGVSHVEARGDTTTWIHCKFGVDWVTMSAARFGLLIKGTGSNARMKHNIFEDCYFVVGSSEADYEHIHVYDTSSIAFGNIFKNCAFMNTQVAANSAIDDAVNSVGSNTEGDMFFINPATNATSFCSTADGVKVVGIVPSAATSGIAVTPS